MTRFGSAWCLLGALGIGIVCQWATRVPYHSFDGHVQSVDLVGQAYGVDPLKATPGELRFLPGIGPGLAQSIYHGVRTEGISSIADLEQIKGIGPARIEAIRESIRRSNQ